jgi:hypothetical protein
MSTCKTERNHQQKIPEAITSRRRFKIW